jgi:Ca-activated chloride channel family protein
MVKLLPRGIVPPGLAGGPGKVAALAGIGLMLSGSWGESPRVDAQFVAGVDLVEVYATVTGPGGDLVQDLNAGDFAVSENGQPQTIAVFANSDVPLAVALAIDRSFSIPADHLRSAAGAAAGFVRALQPADQVMVIGVGSEVEVLAPLSGGRPAALDALARIDSWGTTPLYDAARQAIDLIHAAVGRRALILVSDGADRYSRSTAAELIDHARRRNVLVYPIALGRARPPVFVELAAVTGGRSALASDSQRLAAVFGSIAAELRAQYLLGYSPSREPASTPRWWSIGVRVGRPGVSVRARDGYFGS